MNFTVNLRLRKDVNSALTTWCDLEYQIKAYLHLKLFKTLKGTDRGLLRLLALKALHCIDVVAYHSTFIHVEPSMLLLLSGPTSSMYLAYFS